VSLVREEKDLNIAIHLAKKFTCNNSVVCEEYIEDGIEVSIEAFVLDGVPHVTGIAERHFLNRRLTEPEFIEYGGTMPPTFSKTLIDKCKSVFSDAIKALNITGGPSKGDLIIKNNEVYVLEITSRTSPGFAAEMQPLNSGIKPLIALIKWATGEIVEPLALQPKYSRGVAHRYYIHQPGKIKCIQGLEKLSSNADIKYHLVLNSPVMGMTLGPVSYMNRLLYIITDAETNHEAIKKAENALSEIIIKVE
jgi:biotin carboxylase